MRARGSSSSAQSERAAPASSSRFERATNSAKTKRKMKTHSAERKLDSLLQFQLRADGTKVRSRRGSVVSCRWLITQTGEAPNRDVSEVEFLIILRSLRSSSFQFPRTLKLKLRVVVRPWVLLAPELDNWKTFFPPRRRLCCLPHRRTSTSSSSLLARWFLHSRNARQSIMKVPHCKTRSSHHLLRFSSPPLLVFDSMKESSVNCFCEMRRVRAFQIADASEQAKLALQWDARLSTLITHSSIRGCQKSCMNATESRELLFRRVALATFCYSAVDITSRAEIFLFYQTTKNSLWVAFHLPFAVVCLKFLC